MEWQIIIIIINIIIIIVINIVIIIFIIITNIMKILDLRHNDIRFNVF